MSGIRTIYARAQLAVKPGRAIDAFPSGRRTLVRVSQLRRFSDHVPLPVRKRLKDEAKSRKRQDGAGEASKKHGDDVDGWELTVGIEIHARLHTRSKLFSTAALRDSRVNEGVAPFDLALPGTRPQLQIAALVPAIRAALVLGCQVQSRSAWDRKHYFYQDQPNGYQITQYYSPFALTGALTLGSSDGVPNPRAIRIKQIQLEQDTAKSTHEPGSAQYLIDYSRVGAPLIEIISLPDIHSPSEAAAYVRKIRNLLRHVDACEGNMEVGDLRADVNVSVRRSGSTGKGQHYAGVKGLGTRTEIKNLNSLKSVEDAVRAERDRQIALLEAGGQVEGETRAWTIGGTETVRMRGKEGEVDYRYMPDPDLGPVYIDPKLVQSIEKTMPDNPDVIVQRAMKDFGISEKDARTLFDLDDSERLEFVAESSQRVLANLDPATLTRQRLDVHKVGKTVANWTLHEIGGLLTSAGQSWEHLQVSSEQLADIVRHLLSRQITGRSAKQLLQTAFQGQTAGRAIEQLIQEGNMLLRPMSEQDYQALAQSILDENPDAVAAIKDKGQKGKVMFFVGQMMRRADEGTVEAEKARQVFEQLLSL